MVVGKIQVFKSCSTCQLLIRGHSQLFIMWFPPTQQFASFKTNKNENLLPRWKSQSLQPNHRYDIPTTLPYSVDQIGLDQQIIQGDEIQNLVNNRKQGSQGPSESLSATAFNGTYPDMKGRRKEGEESERKEKERRKVGKGGHAVKQTFKIAWLHYACIRVLL